MIVFGQGAIRCHPYIYKEIEALQTENVEAFDRLFWQHLGLIVRNLFRTIILNFLPFPQYLHRLNRASASFALLADFALISLGGKLKQKEKLAGRFADLLIWMYLATATWRRYEAEGKNQEDLPLVDWAMEYSFGKMQQAFEGILANMPGLGIFSWWWRLNAIGKMPSDSLGAKVAQLLQKSSSVRERLTSGIYLPIDPQESLAVLERAFVLVERSEEILKKIKTAIAEGKLVKGKIQELIEIAWQNGIINHQEAELLQQAEQAIGAATQVDSFTLEEYQNIGIHDLSERLSSAVISASTSLDRY
jgi:acyl-CoA dehydrogenase